MQRIQVVGIKKKRFLWLALLVYALSTGWTWTAIRYDAIIQEEAAGENAVAAVAATMGTNRVLSILAATTSHNDTADRPPLESLSSVDYYACCGLGHRLVRTSLAAYVAGQRNFTLRNFWGWCGERRPVEVFSHLFRPVPAGDVAHVTSRHLVLPFYNEVPGFPALVRRSEHAEPAAAVGPTRNLPPPSSSGRHPEACPSCPADKVASDLALYASLRDRFRHRHVVDGFVRTHFTNVTVIGIHVRAGNNEGGDFEQKGRGISDPDLWVKQIQALVQDQLLSSSSTAASTAAAALDGSDSDDAARPFLPKPVVIYLATDTPSMVTRFRRQFASINIRVLDLPQEGRREEGGGVLFGESNRVHNKGRTATNNSEDGRYGEEQRTPNGGGDDDDDDADDYSSCLKGWSDTLTDMLLLSHADVIIAGKPSSFVQTLPMSLAFGRPKDVRKPAFRDKAYCEVIPHHKLVFPPANGSDPGLDGDAGAEWVETAPMMQCYDSYADWCCNHSTWIKFRYKGPNGRRDKVIAREFVRFPPLRASDPAGVGAIPQQEYKGLRNRTADCPRPRRGRLGGGWKDKCLPHAWTDDHVSTT